MPKVILKFPDRAEPVSLSCQIEADRFSVTQGERVYEGSLVLTGPGEGWLNYGGRIIPFYISQNQDELALWINGGSYGLNLINPETRRSGGAAGGALPGGEVKSPMPGTILKVLVQPGETVEANQPLVLMESMKMEMTLSAPQAATVTDVKCVPGQLVEMGALLVKLETST